MTALVSAAALARDLAAPRPPRLLDVRWALTQPDGRESHAEGHLPGAVYVDLDTELADITVPERGRHPLPSREALEASARTWGLHGDDAVVIYDAGHGFGAARAWWLLRHAGVTNVRVLDGGLDAWIASGGALETGAVTPEPGDITLEWGHMPVLDGDGAATFPTHGVLLDARATERFAGEVEPMDPIAGHIPGAVSAPTTDNVGPDGLLRTPAELVSRFAALGIVGTSSVAVYCGSGVTAAHQILALEEAGLDAALYPGSWSEWSHTPGRPVATGR